MNPSTAVFSQEYAFQRSIFVMGIHSVRSKMTRSSATLGHCCVVVDLYLCFVHFCGVFFSLIFTR